MTQAAALTQAAVATPATCNSKDDSDNMITYNSKNVSNSRTANAVGKGRQQQRRDANKVMKPATACREDNNNMDTIINIFCFFLAQSPTNWFVSF